MLDKLKYGFEDDCLGGEQVRHPPIKSCRMHLWYEELLKSKPKHLSYTGPCMERRRK